MQCSECGGSLFEVNPELYQCQMCNKEYKVKQNVTVNTPKKTTDAPNRLEILFKFIEYDYYKLLLLLLVNYILIEGFIWINKNFTESMFVSFVDIAVSFVFLILNYILGYKLALYKYKKS